MKTPAVDRDERTIAIENISYRWAYLFLSFGLLAIVAFRSFALHESSWDLLSIVILSGVVAGVFRRREHAFTGGAAKSATLAILGGLLAATLLSYGARSAAAVNAGYDAARHAADAPR
jgi:hypothetical protein